MALSFMARKAAKKSIGTHVEVTLDSGDSLEKVTGMITDSDFETGMDITTYEGKVRSVDFSLIKGFQEIKSLEDVLKGLTVGTLVCLSHGSEENKIPNVFGKVVDNDGMEGVEVVLTDGKTLAVEYRLVRSLVVMSDGQQPQEVKKTEPKPEPEKEVIPETPVEEKKPSEQKKKKVLQEEPEYLLNVSDSKIKETYDLMPKDDRKKLSSVYERFKYGIKVNDRAKKAEAANQARQILFTEADWNYRWSREAVLFTAYLLKRANIYDAEVLLVGECFEEASYAAWKESKYDLAGAYAIAALLGNTEQAQVMFELLTASVIKSDDISGLDVLIPRLPAGMEGQLQEVIDEAFSVKGINLVSKQDLAASMTMLSTLYPNTEMGKEAEYWLPKDETGKKDPAPVNKNAEDKKEEPPAPDKPAEPEIFYGAITKLNWSNGTGFITGENGETYTFRYQDIVDAPLAQVIKECQRTDLGGKTYLVKFCAEEKAARAIQLDHALVDRARAIAADATRADRFEVAYGLCKKAIDTSDARRALGDLIKHAITLFTTGQQTGCVKEAIGLYEKYSTVYPSNAFAVMDVALCYSFLKKYPLMLEHAEKALAFPGLLVKQRIAVLANYLKMAREYYEVSGDKALLATMLDKTNELKNSYSKEFEADKQVKKQYALVMLPYRIIAQCGMDMLEEAEADYAQIPANHTYKEALDALMEKTRERLAPKDEEVTAPAEAEQAEENTAEEALQEPEIEEDDYSDDYSDDIQEGQIEEEIAPYVDVDGWDALKLSKKDVIDYALRITGPDRIPAILAYLHAGCALNDKITPVYHAVALAVNDPMLAPDYNLTALVNAMAASDSDYHVLSDCCMAAAFLRTSFLSGRGYDYSAQGLRDSIAVTRTIPALTAAYDTLEAFRKDVGREIDIYADYRNQGVKKLNEEMDITVRRADDLYTKFVVNPAREGVKFFRLLETKKIVFNGYLSIMLNHIIQRDHEALEAEKENFVRTYLNGSAQFSKKSVSSKAVDTLIEECWEQAGKGMQMQKANETLQGNRRNNLRSNISDILDTICQWYALSEQSAGLNWRTEQGDEAYQRLRPQLTEQLHQISEECRAEIESCPDPELCTGLFLLAATAQELSARLDGSWKFEQEKYMYVDFLRSNHVMLNEDFMPDLSATFCKLPEFNILARIRRHVEEEKPSWQEQIDRIYGMDKTCNNYGTAGKVMKYLETIGQTEAAKLPENAELFLSHTEMQIDMRYRSFRETYAFAMNVGQIIKSDAFCYALENTVRYWHAVCKETKNYGFFTSILLQAEEQIHASARQYESNLNKQLDALIAGNQQYFAENPNYAKAIREQIADQLFSVAENWMARIRIGDFSLEMQQPEAIAYLEGFWSNFVVNYNRVSDGGRPLSTLLGRIHNPNKDSRRAQLLIDNWLNNGSPSNPQRIETLLNLLGWQNIYVSQYQFAAEPRSELYEVRKMISAADLTVPQHPIAAFGSALDKKPMYVACLYGNFDCDRLYEKMRTMDAIDGSKVILLDHAMGHLERRALARKLKKRESTLRNVNIVIDRVLITHLIKVYNKDLINRILMATAMPFAYCQPYVVDSINTMPPEIFIGRREELMQIEAADGVNLIYGGRQLGKSALFKKAVSDLDGRQNQRAVLVDINGRDCAAAARRLSEELIALKITPDAEITDDWNVICRNIKQRLRSEENEISYFLLMLDEADKFINDCAKVNYAPLVALKDIQQSLPGRFKYVLAGLHEIVRFNHQVALGNNSVITHMPSLKITPFQTPDAEELLLRPLSYLGFSLPSKVTVSQIIATCNYFPGLIQLYAKKLIESIRAADYAGYDIKKTPPYVVSDEHLRRVMANKDFMEQIYEKFKITLTLDQDQGSCYYPLALLIGWMQNAISSSKGYTAKEVLYHAKELPVYPLAELDVDKIDALLMELQDLNILRSVSSNSYLLASKNFRDLLGSDDEISEKLEEFGGAAT